MKSYVPFLSLRYLRFHKLSTALGMLGVMLGVGLVIVVVGVMDGFQSRLRRSLIGSTSALVLRLDYDVNPEALGEELKATVPGILDYAPMVSTPTLVAPKDGGVRSGGMPCIVMGIDAARETSVNDLDRHLYWGANPDSRLSLIEPATPEDPFALPPLEARKARRFRPEKRGVLLGRGLMYRLGISPGDELRLYTLEEREGEASDRPGLEARSEVFRVTGLYNAGDSEIDGGVILMDRRDARSFFGDAMPREADELRLRIEDPEQVDAVKDAVVARGEALVTMSDRQGFRQGVQPLRARTWKDIHRRILMAVANERSLLIVITSFSFIVVAFLIGSTQSMLVVEKTREIGVLRALGSSVGGTSAVFLGNGFFIGSLGAVLGTTLGVAVATNVENIAAFIRDVLGRDLFPEDIYRFSEVPIEIKPGFVLGICIGAITFALLGAVLPALRAASMDPVESLHHE